MKAKKRKPPAAMIPWRCVVFGVDPGEQGGASVWVAGQLRFSSPASTPEQRAWSVRAAFDVAKLAKLPLVVVAEGWTSQGKMGFKAALGLGSQWGRWLEWIDMQEPIVVGRWQGPKIVRVYPQTWQGALLRARFGMSSEARKQESLRFAANMGHTCETDDEADAFAIGYWGTSAGEVGEVLPAAFRKQAA